MTLGAVFVPDAHPAVPFDPFSAHPAVSADRARLTERSRPTTLYGGEEEPFARAGKLTAVPDGGSGGPCKASETSSLEVPPSQSVEVSEAPVPSAFFAVFKVSGPFPAWTL